MTEGEKAAAEQTHAATTDVRITILAFRNVTLVPSSRHAEQSNVTNPRRLFWLMEC
jgi:hypothetical protein